MTLQDIRQNEQIKRLIETGNRALAVLGYTEHGFAHAGIVSETAGDILCALGYDQRSCELARIAGYIHDIGNAVNRSNHALSGSLLAVELLRDQMDTADMIEIMTAIGNHDEETAVPVTPITAALILADKSDVRRGRVQSLDEPFDIHDRVNYAAIDSSLSVDTAEKLITLRLTIDTAICPVMDYFEIFLVRMRLCRAAADFLGLAFKLIINETVML